MGKNIFSQMGFGVVVAKRKRSLSEPSHWAGAMRLPGPGTIYLSQNLRFVRPVRIGDTVTARVEVAEVMEAKRRVRLTTTVANHHGDNVIDGEAVVMVPA